MWIGLDLNKGNDNKGENATRLKLLNYSKAGKAKSLFRLSSINTFSDGRLMENVDFCRVEISVLLLLRLGENMITIFLRHLKNC